MQGDDIALFEKRFQIHILDSDRSGPVQRGIFIERNYVTVKALEYLGRDFSDSPSADNADRFVG